MLEPGFNARAISIKRRNNPNPLFKRGHVIRGALGIANKLARATMSAHFFLAALAATGNEGVKLEDI
ncbi:hypothetical protein [Mesorhizobium sp. B2-8-5]|uniref:hypothetical protein n=1 Tax=Mesorhizobium sp. B2-8-5 TaxID=2589903 RepID=UPI00112D5424|nr:hypothetical protein [Mesorhizobium sp. B2-8-5]UCI24444.1 hypothetical protein FJ430_23005 [Mesorhizobium sp. B2-8-5]